MTWGDAEGGAQLPVPIAAQLVGLLVGIGAGHAYGIATIVGGGSIPLLFCGLPIEVIDASQELDGWSEGYVGVAMPGRPYDGFRACHTGDPYGWVRLLDGHHPRVDDAVLEVLAFPAEGAGGGPRLHDDVVGLIEPLAVVHRIGVRGHALLADTTDEATYDAAAGHYVHHGDFFRHANGILVDGEYVA